MKPTYPHRRNGLVVGVPIDVIDWPTAQQVLGNWAATRESRYVCICNVHSVVTAGQYSGYRRIIEEADMVTPDGAPIAWTLRRKGFGGQARINGPDLMWRLSEYAQRNNIKIGFFGSTPETLQHLRDAVFSTFPGLDIAYCFSPPFRTLSQDEDNEICHSINNCGIGLLFVGLGCPKQEQWMAEHRGRIRAVMIGVGAAFDYHAGTIRRAPIWMQTSGLEWLFRLASEPRRLWRRYLMTNALFILKTMRGWIAGEFRKP